MKRALLGNKKKRKKNNKQYWLHEFCLWIFLYIIFLFFSLVSLSHCRSSLSKLFVPDCDFNLKIAIKVNTRYRYHGDDTAKLRAETYFSACKQSIFFLFRYFRIVSRYKYVFFFLMELHFFFFFYFAWHKKIFKRKITSNAKYEKK